MDVLVFLESVRRTYSYSVVFPCAVRFVKHLGVVTKAHIVVFDGFIVVFYARFPSG